MSYSDTEVSDDFYCLGDVLMDSFLNPEQAIPISTGFNDLDALLGSWHTGEFILLSGRPAMGRTGLGLSIIKRC